MAASNASGPRAGEPAARGPGAAAVLGALAVFLVLALWRANAPTLWNDEVMSVAFARRSWYGLLRGAASDRVHPPLFYALLKIWIRIGGEGALWLRLLPICTAAAAIPLVGRLCRELGVSRRSSTIGLLIASTSGYLVYYAQELRPYALFLFSSTLSLLVFARAISEDGEKTRSWLWLIPANTLLVYSHYYGWLLLGAEGLWLLLRARRRLGTFLPASLVPVAAFAPWAWLVRQGFERGRGLAGNLAGLREPGATSLLGFFGGLVGPYRPGMNSMRPAVGVALLLVSLALLIPAALGRTPRIDLRAAEFLALFALVPPLISFAVSVWIRPVFHPRYLIESAVPAILLTAIAVTALESRAARVALTATALVWCALGAVDGLTRPSRIAWGSLVSGMRRAECAMPDGGAPVYTLGKAALRPVTYYVSRFGPPRKVIPIGATGEIPMAPGWLAFHSGSALTGDIFWSEASAGAIRSELSAHGLRIVCEAASGPPEKQGVLVGFAPAAEVR